MERERDALVWRLQTFGGALPSRNARDAYDLEPCLDPTLHDQRTAILIPTLPSTANLTPTVTP